MVIEVAGEPKAAADHNAVSPIFPPNPLARGLEQILNLHCPFKIRFVPTNASGVALGKWRIF